jgi:hypothetical protein
MIIEAQDTELIEIKSKIKSARAYAVKVQEQRARLAGELSGAPGIVTVEYEFPEPDILHVYQCMFGHRVGDPVVYRLSFSSPMKWVGISHPWGLKPADIICDERTLT